MKTLSQIILTILLLLPLISCGGSTDSGIFDEPVLIAVDSTNNRLFILEKESILSILQASTRSAIGDQPFVNSKRELTIHGLLPSSPMGIQVLDVSGISRLFILGNQQDDDGNAVFNRILVLDFDGTNLSVASFSPIIVEDGDAGTDDSDNILGGLEVDPTNSRLFVSDATAGILYILNTTDGTESAASINLGGTPNKMDLDGNHLYIANSTSVEADQVIDVINTDDWSATEIDLNVATDEIAVLSNDSGTSLLAKQSGFQQVLIRLVDTAGYNASSAISVADSSAVDGAIISGQGISSSVGGLLFTKNSSGTLYGYVPQSDGNIELLTILSDLSSFTAQAISTTTDVLEGIDVYTDSDGNGSIVYIAASSSGDLVFTDVGSNTAGARY